MRRLGPLSTVLVLVAALTAISTLLAVAAAQLVSYAYDGVYKGRSSIVSDLSGAACPRLPLHRLEIRDGALRAWDSGRQTVKGIITHDGFFNADYYFPTGENRVFEGAVDQRGRLIGGVFHQRCAYVVELHKTA